MGFGNINAWKNLTASAKKRIQTKATKYVQERAYKVLLDAVKISPQFTGTFAANWTIVITNHLAQFVPYRGMEYRIESDRYEGKMDGMSQNLEFQKEIISTVKWNSNISLRNITPNDEGGKLIDTLDGPNVRLRAVNPTGREIGVLVYLRQKYKFIS